MTNALEEMKLARGRYRLVMMACGYVESSTTSWLIFSTLGGEHFATAAEATMELALDLYAKYEDDVIGTHIYQTCCKNTIAGSPDAEFCPKCGTRVKNKDFDPEGFMEYVRGIHSTDCDSYGEAEATQNRDFAFWPWRADDIIGAAKDEVVLIVENGEVVMLHALYETREDLRKLDGNCDSDDWRTTAWVDVRRDGSNGH